MPFEWLHILQQKNVDKVQALHKLKYEWTVADVYDMLEIIAVSDLYAYEEYMREKRHAANR